MGAGTSHLGGCVSADLPGGGGGRPQPGSQLQLLLHPPSAPLTPGPGTHQGSWQNSMASPAADTHGIGVGGLKQQKTNRVSHSSS